MGAGDLVIPGEDLVHTSVLIVLKPSILTGASTPVRVGVYSQHRKLETIITTFAGPRQPAATPH